MRNLTILCIAMLLGFNSAAQPDSPYIYYYSRLLDGWVIERADGTDSRLFAPGVMPPEHQVVKQIGWSPSGEWFAWLSAPEYQTGGIRTFYGVWLVSSNGRRVTFLDGLDVLSNAYWSSEDAVLYLIDETGYEDITVYRANVAAETLEDVTDGDIEPTPTPAIQPDDAADFFLSPDGRYRIALRDGALTDTITGQVVPVRRFSGYSAYDVCGVRWHPDGEWFMRHDSMIYAGGGCPYGIIVSNPSGTVQRELTACPLGGECAGWLPPQAVAHLSPGQAHSVVPEPRLTFSREGDMLGVGWRADSAAFATFEEEYQTDGRIDRHLLIWSFDGESAEVMKIVEVGQCFEQIFFNCEVEWSPDGTRIALASASGTQLVTVENGEIEASDQHFAGWSDTGTPILVETFIDADYDPVHGRIAVIAKPDGQGAGSVEVLDLATGEVVYQRVFGPDYNFVDSVNFLPDGLGLVLAVNAEQQIWTFADDALMPLADVQEVYMTDSRPYDRHIIGFGRASLTHLFDAASGELVNSLNRYAYDVAVSPNGRYLATAGGQGVSLWDMADVLAP